MSKALKIGLIGLGGHMMRSLLPNILANPNLNVVAVADNKKENIDGYLARFPGVKTYTHSDDLIKSAKYDKIEAVIVAVDPKGHEEIAKTAVENNLHIMVEKPACENAQNLLPIAKIAAEKNRVVFVGTMWRYTKVTSLMREWAEKRNLAQMFTVATFPAVLKREGWNVDMLELALYDMFIHPIDYALFWTGMPKEIEVIPYDDGNVLGMAINMKGDKLVSLNLISGSASYHIDISLGFSDGAFASVKDMTSLSVNTLDTWTGTTGTFRDRPTQNWGHGNLYRGYARHGYVEELEAFYSTIMTGNGNLSDIKQAINTMYILEKCVESLRTKKSVKV